MSAVRQTTSSEVRPVNKLKQFHEDENGGMTVFTLFLLVPFLIVAGMAVDFMNVESTRTQVQGCLDGAVLAGAKLDHNITDEEARQRTINWADAGGCLGDLTGDPVVTSSVGERTVTVAATRPVPTFFLRLIGTDQLDLEASSGATNAIKQTEISLVLDISGSMRYNDKIDNLRTASVSFASSVLHERNGGAVSLNVIPYAGQVNPGAAMFDRLGATRLSTDLDAFPTVSSCIEMGPGSPTGGADFLTTSLPSAGRTEVSHFMNWPIAADVMGWGWCPQEDMAIRYAVQEAGSTSSPGSLNHWLANLRMHDGTGTHYGMKYGLALLDPASQGAFQHLNAKGAVPDDFASRPLAWDKEDAQKIIVLMTDGQITDQFRPIDPLHEDNATVELAYRTGDRTQISSRSQNVSSFYSVCDLAKSPDHNVTVYTVAFEAPAAAQTQMRNCATSPSHYFNTSGEGLVEVFQSIAAQVGNLRLTN